MLNSAYPPWNFSRVGGDDLHESLHKQCVFTANGGMLIALSHMEVTSTMKVLVATDGSDFSRHAIAEALRFLDPKSTQFRIVSCWEEPFDVAVTTYDVALEYVHKADEDVGLIANSAADRAKAQIHRKFPDSDLEIETSVPSGTPERLILDEAASWGADLIIVGSHGRGFWGRMLGSVSTGVLRYAPCSVFVGRKKESDK
jgi:nucleotide-binding universal stress UspA family protein